MRINCIVRMRIVSVTSIFSRLKTLTKKSAIVSSLALALVLPLVGGLTPSVWAKDEAPASSEDSLDSQPRLPEYDAKVVTILKGIMSANDIPLTQVKDVRVIAGEELNAMTDGKTIYFTKGLFDTLQTEDQRAFVIGHELAHILEGHVASATKRRVGAVLLNEILLTRLWRPSGGVSKVAQTLAKNGIVLADKRFSRGDEYEADSTAIELLSNTQHDPKAALEVFEIFEAEMGSGGSPEFMRTHPMNKSRIDALLAKYDHKFQPTAPTATSRYWQPNNY